MIDHPTDTADEFSFILKPSAVPHAGIGVFSTRALSKGMKLNFFPAGSIRNMKGSDIPEVFKGYCIAEANDRYQAPMHFNRMEIYWFLNHSFDPNIEKRHENWYTLRQIAAGEEIFINYNLFNEPEELKEAYYQPVGLNR